MQKLVKDGQVAILYSPGFGAGWSTWGEPWMATDRRLIEAHEQGEDVAALAQKIARDDYQVDYVCVLAAKNLRIEWVPQGMAYRIHEYDGNESVETYSILDQIA